MGLFRKKKTDIEPDAIAQETAQVTATKQAARQVQKATLTSGRMASLYQRLYQWIFSVNITANVYQIESGEDTFAQAPLPVRGYYTDLLDRMQKEILPDQRQEFAELFGADNLRRAVENEKTCIRGVFAAKELGAVYEEYEEAPVKWYEFSAEWLKDVNRDNIVLIFSVRHINGDLDTGKYSLKKQELTYRSDGDIDWSMTRAKFFDQAYEGMDFEYDVTEDCMYLHRTRGNSDGDRVTKRYVTTLSSHADFEVSHDSVATVKNLLRKRSAGVEQAIILYRKGGVYGAPFHRYRLTTAPLEEEGANSWIIGRMEDVEEEMSRSDSNKAMAADLNNMLQFFRISMFQINTAQGLIWNIVQDENGFHRQDNPQRLEEYIKKRIDGHRIAPESQGEYLKWLEKGYLQRKTAQGPYIIESHCKDMSDLDFRWYTDTIIAVKDKPGQFMRWRKDDTEAHFAREAEYENKELAHIAKYNGQMLDTMASLVEFRSVESSNHIARVRLLTQILLEDIKIRSPQYELTNKEISIYIQASTMHDIGKIAVPDYILNKEGRYTPEEFAIMKKHTTDGAAIIDRLNMPGQEKAKACIRDVVLHHHERYDGNGYPDRLKGDEIKIGVQAVSLADVYDALVSERCYKRSYACSEAMHMIMDGQCGVFNPCLLESLKACEKKLRNIYEHDEEIRLKSE